MEGLLESLEHQEMDEEQKQRMGKLRTAALVYAEAVQLEVRESREKSLAKTKLEESLMWAIKGIALE